MSDNDVTLTRNLDDNRFELRLDGALAGHIAYRHTPSGALDLFHTEIDPAQGGKGLGQRLVAFALADARENGYKVLPTCPFISRYIDRNPDQADLVD